MDASMIAGLATGLTAAFCQSLSYHATRHYVQRRVGTRAGGGGSRQLLVLAHVWMGLFSVLLLWAVWPKTGVPVLRMLNPLLLMTVFYLAGQSATTFALRYAEPSRVSPLMGFKIVFLAVMATFLTQPRITGQGAPPGLTWMQYVAAALAVVAALSLNYAGGSLRKRAMTSILVACITYSICDWNVTRTNLAVFELVPGVTALQASLVSAGLCYVLSAGVAVALLPAWGSRSGRDWVDAVPFSVIWFVAVLFLYACFSEAGPLLGNILQSTRGLMSLVMGSLLIHLGHLHIEPLADKRVFVRRLAAGMLMFGAVTLYVIREPSQLKMWWWGRQGSVRVTPWLNRHPLRIAGTHCLTRGTSARCA
jgi:hypothetical protein